ncbi:polyisoprenoid diphosphate/phosphate phosphohydrolase PLPP6 [Ambystoma mexicanum]|uniref:polyisoprenoid diphosphate/phosphate phosphohydrolase PLPP6 n=1 Tax=Ambystoma mexicanum TaxID=8296 RepID=UPI0037E90A86
MPSPRITRESRTANSSAGPTNGRLEFISLVNNRTQMVEPTTARLRSSESPVRRRDSFSSQKEMLPEEDCMKLHPSFLGIALRSLLAIDLWLSKRIGVCANDNSSWGSARPLMKLIEISGHGVPWIAGTLYCLYKSSSSAGQEVTLNLFFALILDLILVAAVKGLVRRRRPTHNRMDMFATFSVDKYSFPSGHATRAAMVSRFILNHLVLAIPVRVLIVLWAAIVSLSRVMLGRHNVTDVAFGYFMGHMQYSLVEYLWLSPSSAPALFRLWSY